ncbi:MAG: phosphotransferase [Gammaproteobacteria bacterium]|nr:phosphotransferase [Gammaproteobacteria bacterium]MYD75789.1 phosphotransferase [Gammaproteobacteria bacterium]
MDDSRTAAMNRFIADCGWSGAAVTSLVPDASFRRYHRLDHDGRQAMLMDAPPGKEDLTAFVLMTSHLHKLGVRCPTIYRSDLSTGFALIEDLGDLTFTRLLEQGNDETFLYSRAIRLLAALHNHPDARRINLGHYDFDQFIQEALLFTDWYLPAITQRRTGRRLREDYIEAWRLIHQGLSPGEETLVLRDYHVDNLMQADDDCAVLDYQDALIGPPVYDVVSLLEDARRDVSRDLGREMTELYLSLREGVDPDAFLHHCTVWGAQRHAKVAGIFTRLWIRDGKPVYLKHIPRVLGYLERSMANDVLKPVRDWFHALRIELAPVETGLDRKRLLDRSGP